LYPQARLADARGLGGSAIAAMALVPYRRRLSLLRVIMPLIERRASLPHSGLLQRAVNLPTIRAQVRSMVSFRTTIFMPAVVMAFRAR